MKRLELQISNELLDEIKALAKEQETDVSKMIRKMIKKKLKTERRPNDLGNKMQNG